MSIQSLLGETAKADFLRDYYLKLPFARPGGARELAAAGGWEMIDGVLSAAGADAMVVRRGERVAAEAPQSAEQCRRLVEEGCTVLVRHAERHDETLAALAAGFAEDFAAPVNIHVYVTPPGQFGFGWHYDAEEVFVLQTQGSKQYSLRKNTVHPWPLEESLPADMHYEREIMPLFRCTLAAGDWLYLPAGYWHQAEGQGEEVSISLAVGVMAPAAVSVLDFLRQDAPASILWRQRISPLEGAEQLAGTRELLRLLANDLKNRLEDEQTAARFLQWLSERQSCERQSEG